MKYFYACIRFNKPLSPPSRGAWIEMTARTYRLSLKNVAPLAGGVD